ncbi:hypothetical protein Tco_1276448 [Tanacetum coccineum]
MVTCWQKCGSTKDRPFNLLYWSYKVVKFRYEKRSKSENKGKVPTEMELVLEQTQQGTSYEVSVSAEGVEELKRKVKIKGEKKEAILTLRQKSGFKKLVSRLGNSGCGYSSRRSNVKFLRSFLPFEWDTNVCILDETNLILILKGASRSKKLSTVNPMQNLVLLPQRLILPVLKFVLLALVMPQYMPFYPLNQKGLNIMKTLTTHDDDFWKKLDFKVEYESLQSIEGQKVYAENWK